MENEIPRVAINITNDRVGNYTDVVEYMIREKVAKCKEEGWTPSLENINSYRKKLIIAMTVRGDIDQALKIPMPRTVILKG